MLIHPLGESRVLASAGHQIDREQANEPQGCVWLKQATGSVKVQTVEVVKNDEGGPKQVWKPATR
jgi:hypothetical protein